MWNQPRTALHNHDYCEIFLITQGTVHYLINGEKIILEKNTLSFVRPSDTHQFLPSPNGPQQHLNIAGETEIVQKLCDILSPSLFDKLMQIKNAVLFRINDADFNHLLYIVNRINLVDASNKSVYSAELLTLLFNAISLLNKYLSALKSPYPAWFDELLAKIHSSAFLDRSVADLYKLSSYSPPILIAAFKQNLGVTPVQYLTKLKISHACNLLKHTDFTTLSISTTIGYDSLSHFNHVFKQYMGVSPGEYRKNYLFSLSRQDTSNP